jgi:hypothetical protein
MFDQVIRKSESALARVVLTIVLGAIAMLGLVWLSIALAGWYASMMGPSLAAAMTGVTILAVAGIAFALADASASASRTRAKAAAPAPRKTDDVVSRATSIAERMAPDTPMVAVAVALAAGIASVSLPDEMSPFLNKILDDVENAPGASAGR